MAGSAARGASARGAGYRGERDSGVDMRVVLVAVFVASGFIAVAARMTMLAGSDGAEPNTLSAPVAIAQSRADIVDREGRLLATNLDTYSLYAQPPDMVDPVAAARELARVFPDLDADRLVQDFTGKRKFLWIKKRISPEQRQAVHDIGDPGLRFGPREMRLYPNGPVAAHVLGGAGFGLEGVHAAEVVGLAGVERHFDQLLRDPARNGMPLRLSIDLSVQAAVEEKLADGMVLMNALGAAAVLMNARTGEILALASLPDFDPNDRSAPAAAAAATAGAKRDDGASPLFNRAVQGVYELGSVFKIFTAAQALELGIAEPDTEIDTEGPLKWGKFSIGDVGIHEKSMTVTDIIRRSSNVGAARLALEIGASRQRGFMEDLGLLDATGLELSEASVSGPIVQRNWSEITTMTVSYGHGISVSPVHLAAAYATIANGGWYVMPTLLADPAAEPGPRVVSAKTSADALAMLRSVVTGGTATMAEVPGYAVGGKTGTGDKPSPDGGYHEDRVVATFAGAFPVHAPEYVIVVALDEPELEAFNETRRTAGWTAAPVAGELVRRVAPLLGLAPEVEVEVEVSVAATAAGGSAADTARVSR